MATSRGRYSNTSASDIDIGELSREASRNQLATGIIGFAAVLMIGLGGFHAIAGVSEILSDNLIVIPRDYAYDLDVTVWGWIHLVTGVIFVLVGIGLFTGALIARIAGVVVAVLSLIVNFMFLPVYPFWAGLMIAIDALLVWALTTRGWVMAEGRRRV
jgi:hypothetical protein